MADLNVRNYGAKGDGTSDDTAAFQSFINDVQKNTARGYVPSGTYMISSPLVISSAIKLYGDGKFNTIIKATSGFNNWVIKLMGAGTGASTLYGVSLVDMTIDGNAPAQTTGGGCMTGYGVVHCEFTNVRFTRGADFAVWLQGTTGGAFGHNNSFNHCLFDNGNTTTGTLNGGGFHANSCDENFFLGCDFEYNGKAGATNPYAFLDEAGTQYLTGCNFVNGLHGVKMNNAPNLRVTGCHFDGVGGDAITLVGTGAVISGNTISQPGFAAANTYSGIHVAFAGGGHTIVGNQFTTATSGVTSRSFYREQSPSTPSVLVGNRIVINSAFGTAEVEDGGVGTTYLANFGWPDTMPAHNMQTQAASYQLTLLDNAVQAGANNLTFTLADATKMTGRTVLIFSKQYTGITLAGWSGQTINGVTTNSSVLASAWGVARLISNGVNWLLY